MYQPPSSLMPPAGVISALEPDPRRPESIRVFVAGSVYCTIPRDVAEAERLEIGRPVEAALHERLGRAADAEASYRTVLRALEHRAYAAGDLTRRLVRRGHPREAVAAAVERAERIGLIDDAAFAVQYVATRAARGRGPARLRADLGAMGVERGLVDRAIAEHWSEDADHSSVPLALATKRAAQLGDLPRPVKRRRLLAYLARRGYGGHEVSTIVARLVG